MPCIGHLAQAEVKQRWEKVCNSIQSHYSQNFLPFWDLHLLYVIIEILLLRRHTLHENLQPRLANVIACLVFFQDES
jgi:hypothetical protein